MENVGVNKVLINGGEVLNLMSHSLLRKIGKYDTDLRTHNMVLPNYEGKIGHTIGVLQVDVTMGSITRLTIFMVIASKASYNLLLGREWIHGVGEVPSALQQRLAI